MDNFKKIENIVLILGALVTAYILFNPLLGQNVSKLILLEQGTEIAPIVFLRALGAVILTLTTYYILTRK